MSHISPFTLKWWFWQLATGVSLALTLGCKMVGLFTFLTIGLAVAIDIWKILDYRRGYTMVNLLLSRYNTFNLFFIELHFKTNYSTYYLLIIVPFIIYLATFWVHFKILKFSGPGDTFMSPQFQETLEGNPVLQHSKGKLKQLNKCKFD